MRRAWFILLAGLFLAIGGYCALYFAGTSNCASMMRSPNPELAWLKDEFHLNDAEFARISRIHETYLEGCAERCRLIDAKNSHLRHLLAASQGAVTPEIEQALSEAAQLRVECEKQMLQGFYEVSRTMPPEQGKRYLEWVQARTIVADSHSQMHH